jgi:outer membrane protein, heavy metal efflux system
MFIRTGPPLAVALLVMLIATCPAYSQEARDTVRFNRAEAETRLLEQNLLLLAASLEIDQAEARIVQARVWPNPTLEIDEVNFWATQRQLGYFGEELPPIDPSGFGRNQQITIQVEQVIRTAGKRGRLIALERVGRDIAAEYLQDVLRGLRREFRQDLAELLYQQQITGVLERQMTSTEQLVAAFVRLSEVGDVDPAEVLRLETLLLELRAELRETQAVTNVLQAELAVLLALPANSYMVVDPAGMLPAPGALEVLSLADLNEQARANNPDLRLAELDRQYHERALTWEKAQRTPDLALRAGYDRGGNFMKDFVGFGIGLELPVLDRNRGNIRAARSAVEQRGIMRTYTEDNVLAQVSRSYFDLQQSLALYNELPLDRMDQLDAMLDSHTRNFQERNIAMLRFLDFFETYRETRRIIHAAERDLAIAVGELTYHTTTELY